jgi:MFS family permease
MAFTAHIKDKMQLLHNRAYRVTLIGQTISSFGDSLVPISLAFAILKNGGDAAQLGIVLGCRQAAGVVLYLAGGVAADRASRKHVMIAADVIRGGTQIIMGLLFFFGGASVLALCACVVFQGLAGGFYTPAAQGLTPSLVSKEELSDAYALREIASDTARILGPLVAGGLVVTVGPAWGIVVNGASFGLNAVVLSSVVIQGRAKPKEPSTVWRDLRAGWAAFSALGWYATLTAAAAVSNFCIGIYSTLGPVIAQRFLGGASSWAVVGAVAALGTVIGGLFLIRGTPRRPLRTGQFMVFLMCAMQLSVGLGLPVPIICVCAAFGSAGALANETFLMSTVQRIVPDDVLSRVISYDYFFSFMMYPAGLIGGGLLSSALGPKVVVVGSAGLLGLVALLTLCQRTIWQFELPGAGSVAETA